MGYTLFSLYSGLETLTTTAIHEQKEHNKTNENNNVLQN